MNFVSTLGAAALSCLLLPAAFASEPAGTALEPSSATIAPKVREVEKAPSTELAAAPSASSSPEAFSDSKSDNSNTWRPRITILLDTGMTSSLVETAAEELKLVGDAADVEVLVRGLPVTRTPTGYRTDFEATSERLAPLVDAGFGAAIHPERFAFLLALAEEGLEAGGRLDARTEEVYEVMTAAVAPRQRARARMLVSDSCLLGGCGNVDERSERSRPGAYRGGRLRPSICRVRP